MTPNCEVVVNVILPICSHIESGMTYLNTFVEETIALHVLGAITCMNNGCVNFSVVRIRK